MLVGGAEVAVVAIVFGTVSGTILSIVKTMANRSRPHDGVGGGELDLRLQRIEQAVDAIAIEVERMSESQRFTTKILAERLPPGTRALSDSSIDRG
jgi:hypothetical protein